MTTQFANTNFLCVQNICNQDIVEQHFAALRYIGRKGDTPGQAQLGDYLMQTIARGSTGFTGEKTNCARGGEGKEGSRLVAAGEVVRAEQMTKLFAAHEAAAEHNALNCALVW